MLEHGQEKPVKRSAASKKLEVKEKSELESVTEYPVTKVGWQSEVIGRVRTREGQQ